MNLYHAQAVSFGTVYDKFIAAESVKEAKAIAQRMGVFRYFSDQDIYVDEVEVEDGSGYTVRLVKEDAKMKPTMAQMRFNKWVMQNYGDHFKVIHEDKGTVTRVQQYIFKAPSDEISFEFTGINPLKLPRIVQESINGWMRRHCIAAKQGIWDCEAWTDEPNTKVVL